MLDPRRSRSSSRGAIRRHAVADGRGASAAPPVRDPCCAAKVHGMGMHDGREYMVGERVTGTLMRNLYAASRMAPDAYLARASAKLTSRPSHAHEAGIAVGEVSGATVLVGQDRGRLVLGRLSLSQVPACGAARLATLAPEVARGEVAGRAIRRRQRASICTAFGCSAIELACGHAPFADEDRAGRAPRPCARSRHRVSAICAATCRSKPHEDLVEWLLAKQLRRPPALGRRRAPADRRDDRSPRQHDPPHTRADRRR